MDTSSEIGSSINDIQDRLVTEELIEWAREFDYFGERPVAFEAIHEIPLDRSGLCASSVRQCGD